MNDQEKVAGISIGQDGKTKLCIGILPGRKRPSLYFWDALDIRVLASFQNDSAAEAVESFILNMDGAKVAVVEANELLALIQKPGEPVGRATDRDIRLVCAYAKDHFKRDPMDPTRYERAVERLLAKLDSAPPQPERDREVLESIRIYGSDTLSGRVDGPEDAEWYRGAVVEMTRRAFLGGPEDE